MPNWCYTQVCFRGKPENIERLRKDVEAANEFGHRHMSFCNVRYLLSLQNFDTVSYYERFKNKYIPNYYDCNFRGNVFDTQFKSEEHNDGLVSYYPTFEMAWYTDYQLLQLISMIYDVKFSAYSEEPGCEIYDKCRNDSSIDEYDFDYIISPDYEQFEEALDENPEGLDLDYNNAVKQGSEEEAEIINILKERGITYGINPIETIPVPDPYGVYYHYNYGVIYDTDFYEKFMKYPELDPFNRYSVKGVTYDTDE